MTTISSVSSAWSSASVQRASRPGPSPERLLSKIDTDGSGGVSDTELQGLLDNVAKKTGVSSQTSAADLVTRYDANGDGSLNADELGKTLQSVLPPPPSTMAFAQSRSGEGSSSATSATGQAGDDLFGKVDSDGDGAVSKTELQALLEAMSGGTANQTGVSGDDGDNRQPGFFREVVECAVLGDDLRVGQRLAGGGEFLRQRGQPGGVGARKTAALRQGCGRAVGRQCRRQLYFTHY